MTLLAPTPTLARKSAAEVLCAHCSSVVPPGLIEPGADDQFCCGGCRAVFDTIHACGLDSYYRLRDAAEVAPRRPASPSESGFDAFDSASFETLYVQCRPDGSACVDLVLEGVSCAACVWLIERLPRVLDGVIEARLSLREATVRITWDPQRVALSRIARTLDRIGYTPHPARGISGQELHQRETRRRLIHLGIAGAIMGNTMLLGLALYAGDASGHMEPQYRTFFRWLSALLGMVSLAWPGATFFRSSWAALRARGVNLDVPIALALLAGGAAGMVNVIAGRGEIYFDSLTVLIFLLLVGRFIQYRQQRRADDAVGLLFSLTPASCRVARENEVIELPIEALAVGDIVEVRAGELFPADGTVVAGVSSVNQSLLSGESMPTAVEVGSDVHAGAQNLASTLRVRVGRVGRDTRVGQLMGLIERGVREKPPIVQFTDRIGGWFLLAVVAVSLVTFIVWWRVAGLSPAIDHTVALLIVTCPCVLGLATPMTLAIAIGKLARRDILVKSGVALEKLSRGGSLLLDKTGTITEGRLQLLGWTGDENMKPLVAALEGKSNHPVGRALYEALMGEAGNGDALAVDVVEKGDGGLVGTVDGRSVLAGSPRFAARHGVRLDSALEEAATASERSGATAVIVAVDRVACAVASLGDEIRRDSAFAIGMLRRLRWKPAILSGDARGVVASVASEIEVDDATGALSPEEKLQRVERRAGDGALIVMVGDGVNDAAALAAADVGIAVHGGAEASLAAADIYVARPGLSPLVELVETSRLAMRTIRRNLLVSLGYNLLAGTLAAAGIMTPLLAAIIMPLSSATVMSLAVASIGGAGLTAAASKGGRSWK